MASSGKVERENCYGQNYLPNVNYAIPSEIALSLWLLARNAML